MGIRCLCTIVPQYAFLRVKLRGPGPKILHIRHVSSIVASQFPTVAELDVWAGSGVAVVLVSGGVVVFVSWGGPEGSAAQESVYEGLENWDAAGDDDGARFDAGRCEVSGRSCAGTCCVTYTVQITRSEVSSTNC
jgi:hypothetical protein